MPGNFTGHTWNDMTCRNDAVVYRLKPTDYLISAFICSHTIVPQIYKVIVFVKGKHGSPITSFQG